MHSDETQIDYLNAADKHWIGAQLKDARNIRGLAITSVAQLTCLSQSQIMAIEAGSQGPFVSIAHYVGSVRVYSKILDTEQSTEVLSWLDQLDEGNESMALSGSTAQPAKLSQVLRIDKFFRTHLGGDLSKLSKSGRLSRMSSVGVSAALIALGFMITVPLMWEFDKSEPGRTDYQVVVEQAAVLIALDKQESPIPAVTKLEALAIAEPVKPIVPPAATLVAQAAVAQAPERMLGLRFTAPCWVQVTTRDGQVTDRVYEISEVLNLDLQKIASLVIGNAGGTTAVTQNGNAVDFNAFVAGGNVARLKADDLVSLAYR